MASPRAIGGKVWETSSNHASGSGFGEGVGHRRHGGRINQPTARRSSIDSHPLSTSRAGIDEREWTKGLAAQPATSVPDTTWTCARTPVREGRRDGAAAATPKAMSRRDAWSDAARLRGRGGAAHPCSEREVRPERWRTGPATLRGARRRLGLGPAIIRAARSTACGNPGRLRVRRRSVVARGGGREAGPVGSSWSTGGWWSGSLPRGIGATRHLRRGRWPTPSPRRGRQMEELERILGDVGRRPEDPLRRGATGEERREQGPGPATVAIA